MGRQSIVLVDDEPALTRSLSMVLYSNGYEDVVEFNDSRQALRALEGEGAALVVCDLGMPHLSGLELLQRLGRTCAHIPVIVATAVNEVDTAVQCMKSGAVDYLVKPVREEELIKSVAHIMQLAELRRENCELRARLSDHSLRNPAAFAEILTNSPRMHSLFEYMEVVAPASQPVLISGETGTGKELVARALHKLRGKGDFIAVNVAGLDENAFSDTLFGHLKGAFTGADSVRRGLVEKAGEGTVFLDEIGDLSAGAQIKLLRLLQEREYLPLGADDPRRTSARFVLATLHDLEKLVEEGAFRRDLYYRLRQYQLDIPPLRERREDLPLLAQAFLDAAAQDLGRPEAELTSPVLEMLNAHSFPGNVRELQSLMNTALSRSRDGRLMPELLRNELAQEGGSMAARDFSGEFLQSLPMLPPLRDVRNLLVQEALRRTGGNQALAARMLGVTRQAINKHMNRGGADAEC